jgi:type IV pilus assembly protein PilB
MPEVNVVHNLDELQRALRELKPVPEMHLGDILISAGALDTDQLQAALARQRAEPSKHIGQILEEMGAVKHDQVTHALGRKFGIPVVDLESFKPEPDILTVVPPEVEQQYNVLPLAMIEGRMILAMDNPLDWEARDVIQFYVNRNVEAVIASARQISEVLSRHFSEQDAAESLEELQLAPVLRSDQPNKAERLAEQQAMQKPIVRLLNAILLQAVVRNASDINVRPEADRVNVYYRVDGKLQFVRSLHRSLLPPLVSRIKITGQMDIAEHHMPQDGHARLRRGTNDIDLRISVIPTVNGESVVIRILDKKAGLKPLDQVGFHEHELTVLRELISRSFGIFLVTGPTGSGKSTTLYAVLNEVKKGNPHIITVEDPVEYDMKGVEQIQVSVVRGYTFAEALRHILRHDPDVIMIGEVRDLETARIANKAALTGHLVVSTLHTNDAASAITRLIDMGIEPYLLSATLLGTMAQRLVRLNCPNCKEEEKIHPHVREELGLGKDEVFYRGKGCMSCNFSGYHGRQAVCELLPVTPGLRELITAGKDAVSIKQKAIEEGMVTLTKNAIALAREGKTSIEEVYAVRLD